MSSRIHQFVSGFIVLVACTASAAGPLSSEEHKVIALPETAPVTLIYRAVDSLNVPYTDSTVTHQLTQRALEATGMPSHGQVKPDGTKLVSGVRAVYVIAKHELVVFYEAHEVSREGLVLGQTIAMPIHIDETKQADQRIVKLTFPSQASSASKKLFLFSAPQLNTDDVLADYARVISAIQRAELQVQTQVSGEIESKYRPDAVLANFDRLVGRDRSSNGAIRTETSLTDKFFFKGKEFSTTIAVTAFPYRDGSKVQYSAGVPLKLEPDGTAQGDGEIKVIRDLVAKVVND